MSRRVLAVCEGPTDFIVLQAVLAAVEPSTVAIQIQPESSRAFGHAGPHGGGWKGVRSWCTAMREAGSLGLVTTEVPDVYVLHVDADIAEDAEVSCARPSPPAQETCDAIRRLIENTWLGGVRLSGPLLTWIAAQATETWVLAALRPEALGEHPECFADPARLLVGKPYKLVGLRDGKKRPSAYREIAPLLRQQWPSITALLPEAARLDHELRAALTSS